MNRWKMIVFAAAGFNEPLLRSKSTCWMAIRPLLKIGISFGTLNEILIESKHEQRHFFYETQTNEQIQLAYCQMGKKLSHPTLFSFNF